MLCHAIVRVLADNGEFGLRRSRFTTKPWALLLNAFGIVRCKTGGRPRGRWMFFTPTRTARVAFLEVDRQHRSLFEAIVSAIEHVERAGYHIERIELEREAIIT